CGSVAVGRGPAAEPCRWAARVRDRSSNDGNTTAHVPRRDHPLLSRGRGGRTPGGGAVTARVCAHEGGRASLPATPAGWHSRCRGCGRCLRPLAGREGISSPPHRPGAATRGGGPTPERGIPESDLHLSGGGRAGPDVPGQRRGRGVAPGTAVSPHRDGG